MSGKLWNVIGIRAPAECIYPAFFYHTIESCIKCQNVCLMSERETIHFKLFPIECEIWPYFSVFVTYGRNSVSLPVSSPCDFFIRDEHSLSQHHHHHRHLTPSNIPLADRNAHMHITISIVYHKPTTQRILSFMKCP